jgi:hypothetical protein
MYHDVGDYRGSIVVPLDDGPPAVWKFRDLYAPQCGFGPGIAYDSPEAYDQMAQFAACCGSCYTTMNRSEDDDLEGYPSGEVADIIDDAVSVVLNDNGTYEVRRQKGTDMIANVCKAHASLGKGKCPGCKLATWIKEEVARIEADKRYQDEIDPSSKTPFTLEQVSLRARVRVLKQVEQFIAAPPDEDG